MHACAMRTWCSAARLQGSGYRSSWRRSDTRHIRRARGPNQHSTVSPYTQRSPASHASARNNCSREKGNSDKITPFANYIIHWKSGKPATLMIWAKTLFVLCICMSNFYVGLLLLIHVFVLFGAWQPQFLSGSLKSQKKRTYKITALIKCLQCIYTDQA